MRRWIFRTVRAFGRVIERSPARRLSRLAVVERLRERFVRTRPRDVVAVVRAFEAANVPAWLAGGWGVDALVGSQTRRHFDIDVVVLADDARDATEESPAVGALAELGYRAVDEAMASNPSLPNRTTLRDTWGHTVDLLPIERPADDFFARGEIAGVEVPCISAAAQRRLHEGYELRDVDRRDLTVLDAHTSGRVSAR